MNNGTKYMFNNPSDMIMLAHKIQTCVFWGWRFRELNDMEEHLIPYREFWETADTAHSDGYIGVWISEDDHYVNFLHPEDD